MKTQLTFQGLLDALAAVPQDATVMLSGFGGGSTPGVLFRHRPFVDGLSITPTMARPALQLAAAEFIDFLNETGPHKTWRGHGRDGFIDRYPAGQDTPMWVGFPHDLSFYAVTGVEMVKGFAVIRSTDLAPEQGPSIQRVSDEEAINRMRVEHLQRTGQDTVFAPHVERHLLRMLPDERSNALLNLEEARHELATFESSLQAKKDRVAKLERDAVRNDYLLGIRDDLPGAESGCNGICHRASDVGVSVPGDPVAYAHESCPEHGSGATND
jgi:hypothetical protein